jgi:hypothetical protein
MREAEINDAITKLYDMVDTYSADDRWYFDMPLAIRLCKPLHSRRRWLVNARILVNKSADIELVYSISADAGDETIILAKRCSVTPLKCICCVEPCDMGMVPPGERNYFLLARFGVILQGKNVIQSQP